MPPCYHHAIRSSIQSVGDARNFCGFTLKSDLAIWLRLKTNIPTYYSSFYTRIKGLFVGILRRALQFEIIVYQQKKKRDES